MSTVVSLTIAEIVAITSVIVSLLVLGIKSFNSLSIRVKALEVRVTQNEDIQKETRQIIETIRIENREDHGEIKIMITDFISNVLKQK